MKNQNLEVDHMQICIRQERGDRSDFELRLGKR